MTEQTRRASTCSGAVQLMLFSGDRPQATPAPQSTGPVALASPAWLGDDMEPDPVCTSEFADHARLLHEAR